jgi:hypothetical protein
MRTRLISGGLLTALFVAATALPAAAADTVRVRAFHDSPDTPKVEILADGAETGVELEYGDITDYLRLAPGTVVRVQLVDDPSIGLEITVPDTDRPITVAAIGLAGALLDDDDDNDGQALRLQPYEDRAGFGTKVARVRIVHTSADAPKVDIQAYLGGHWMTVVDGLGFGKASKYLTLPRGSASHPITYRFRVVVDGTHDVVTRISTPLPFPALTVWAVGLVGEGVDNPAEGSMDDENFDLFITRDGRN